MDSGETIFGCPQILLRGVRGFEFIDLGDFDENDGTTARKGNNIYHIVGSGYLQDDCERGGGTRSVSGPYEPSEAGYDDGYFDSSWRIIEEPIQSYYKTCGNNVNCSAYGYDCGRFTPTQLYWKSYTVYAEHYIYHYICSNNSSLNYWKWGDEDGNEVRVEEDDDHEDATHERGECGANASEACWDEYLGLYYITNHYGIPRQKTRDDGVMTLCENYGKDCSSTEEHPLSCDSCYFEVEDLGSFNDTLNGYPIGDSYGVPSRCDIVLPTIYAGNRVDCGYRGRDIYRWGSNGTHLLHYSGVWGTEGPRAADGYEHTHTDTRYCGGAHGHRVLEAPTTDLCLKGTANPVQESNDIYYWTCSYGSIGSSCWACKTGDEESCWHYM